MCKKIKFINSQTNYGDGIIKLVVLDYSIFKILF